MTRRRDQHRGFSLLEWMIAITVTCILAAFLIPTVLHTTERTREGRAKADVAGIAKAIAKMRQDTGNTSATCLTSLANLQSSTLVPDCNNSALNLAYTMTLCNISQQGRACWGGPYISSLSVDPWSNQYQVTYDTSTWAICGMSNGPDGIASTSDDISYVQ